jgi:hypothetical protein
MRFMGNLAFGRVSPEFSVWHDSKVDAGFEEMRASPRRSLEQ